MEKIGKITIFLIMVALLIVFNAFVMTKLWFWFITPVFNIPVLTLTQAIGLNLFLAYLQPKKIEVNSEDWYEAFKLTFKYGVIFNIIVLLFGWLFTLFI